MVDDIPANEQDSSLNPYSQPVQVAAVEPQMVQPPQPAPQDQLSMKDQLASVEQTKQQIAENYPAPQPQEPVVKETLSTQPPPPPAQPQKPYSFADYANAFWHENDFYVMYDTMRDQYLNGAIDHTPDPTFNPVEASKGTWLEGKFDQLIHLHNRAEFDRMVSEGNEHIENDKIISSLGWAALPLRVANGMASPALAIPGMMGPKAWGLAAKMAVAGGFSAAAMEPWYRANDPTRTNEDSAIAIGAGTVGAVVFGKALNYVASNLTPFVERIKQARGEAPPVYGESGNNHVVNVRDGDFTAYTSDNPFGPEAPAVTHEMRQPDGERVVTDGDNTVPVRGEMNGVQGEVGFAPEPPKAWVHSEYKGEIPQTEVDKLAQGRTLDNAGYGPQALQTITDRAGNVIDGIAKTSAGKIVGDVITPLGRAYHFWGDSIVGSVMTQSHSKAARATLLDLADTAIRPANQQFGEVRSLNGGPVEIEKRIAQDQDLYNSMRAVDEAYAEYRFGDASKEPMLRATGGDYWGMTPRGADQMSYREFMERVYLALNRGDKDVGAGSPDQALPQVEAAAAKIRGILQFWEKRAQGVQMDDGSKLLADELGSPLGADTYAPQKYSKAKIDADPIGFVNMIEKSVRQQHELQVASREKIKLYHDSLESSDEFVETLNKIIDGGQEKLDALALRQEEVRRFNKFAYQRSESLSTPLDEARANIRRLTAAIEPQLSRLEQIRSEVAAIKETDPAFREAENSIFNIINASQGLKQSKSAFEQIAGADDLVNHIDALLGTAKGGIKEARNMAKWLTPAEVQSLRRVRGEIAKEIAPYAKEIKKNRKELTRLTETRGPLAKGGAVFETEIRNRGNSLANKETAYIATVEDAKMRLANEMAHNNNMRELLEKEIQGWAGKSGDEAKAALAARAEAEAERAAKVEEGTYKGTNERLTAADRAVRNFANRVKGRVDLDMTGEQLDRALRDKAAMIADDIRYSSNTRLNYEGDAAIHGSFNRADDNRRGSFKGRTVPIPIEEKIKFLETDMRDVMATWARTVPTDVIFAERMGSLDLKNRFAIIDREYTQLREQAVRDFEGGSINKVEFDRKIKDYEYQNKMDKENLRVAGERLRGIYGYTADMTTVKHATMARDLQSVATAASLGRAVLSSFNDAGAAHATRWGLGNLFRSGYFPMVKALATMKGGAYHAEMRKQAKDFGLGVDTALSLMRYRIPEIVQGPDNVVSKALSYTASRSQLFNMMLPWTDEMKSLSVGTAQNIFGETAERVAKGKATDTDLKRLFDANIPVDVAREIGEQYSKHAGDAGTGTGFRFANIDKWDNERARKYFQMAMRREAETVVMTPGVATAPIWTPNATLAPLFQFKSFVWRAHEVMLTSNMQNYNHKLWLAYAFAGGLGTLSYYARKLDKGEDMPDDPMEVVKDVSDLASIVPIWTDLNKQASAATNGRIDAWNFAGVDHPYSRANDQSKLQSVFGPSLGMGLNVGNALLDAASGNFTGKSAHDIRKALPGQNHFAAWPLFDATEAFAVDQFGLKPTKGQKKMMDNWGF